MSEPYIGQIIVFPYTFAPVNYAFCEGQLINISQNQALFTIIGTTYGGNGTSNFALPDMRTRVALGQGQGPGLSNYVLGETAGTESVTLLSSQMPMHNHIASASNIATLGNETAGPVAGSWIGDVVDGKTYSDQPSNAQFAANVLTQAGGNQPHDNMQPFLGLHYCIGLYGIFPTRS